MRYSKEEFLQRINDIDTLDDETKIALMEDISDSIVPEEATASPEEIASMQSVIDELTEKYDALVIKYKERFLNPESEEEEDKEEESEEIDVKEI